MLELLVGLPEENVLAVDDGRELIEIHVSADGRGRDLPTAGVRPPEGPTAGQVCWT
jgi:hypothetical protein